MPENIAHNQAYSGNKNVIDVFDVMRLRHRMQTSDRKYSGICSLVTISSVYNTNLPALEHKYM